MLELAPKQYVEGQPHENGNDENRLHQPHYHVANNESSNGKFEVSMQQHAVSNPHHHLPSSFSSKEGIIKRKLLLLSPLLICLYILTDTTHHVPLNNNGENNERQQHLAFVTALSRHPPALRVFRIISESAFLLFCTAFALWAWEKCSSSLSENDDESLEQFSNQNNNNHGSSSNPTTTAMLVVSIPSQTVGKLLFAPPPNSITDNVAWKVYKKHHHRLLVSRKRRTGGGGNSSSKQRMKMTRQNSNDNLDGIKLGERGRNEDDLIELQQQQQPKEDDDDDEHDLSPLMDTPPRNTGLSALHDRLGDNTDDYDDDDDYIENDNRNDHRHHKNNNNNNVETSIFQSQQTTSASAAPKPPSSASVLGAALDITTVMCMFLIFFTISSAEGGRYIDHKARGGINISPNHINHNGGENDNNNNEISYMKFFAKIAAPLFPITLFILSIILIVIPWRKRKVLWTIVSLTLGAPFYEVTFRDGFIGDILTSTVRPLQDLAYTIVFLFLGLQAWWDSQAYNTTTTTSAGDGEFTTTTMDDVPLERSWFLHTLVLPACTLSPLWWRFLQNLRQCFDTKQRWPHLGNALKYMVAAEVAIFGMFDPSMKKHPLWIGCFFIATLYQVWWDVFMDWGLLEWDVDDVTHHYYHSNSSSTSSNKGSGSGSSRKVLFWWWPYKLRSQRAYPHRWIYHIIFIINFCLRFVGMLTLIPPVYLSRRTGLIVNTWYDPDFQLFVGSLAASAEIFRRTIWALLRLEWEVIKTSPTPLLLNCGGKKSNDDKMMSKDDDDEDDDLRDLLGEETDMKPMAISSSSGNVAFSTFNERRRSKLSLRSLSDMSNLNDIQILSELCAWATIFSGIAIIAAAHREVL